MNIQVTNLDEAYTKCEELNTLVSTSGTKLLGDLGTDISNLKVHWKGNDATVHINNLIAVYEGLVSTITAAKQITAAAGSEIIAIQQVRQANGGSGPVGSELSPSAPESNTYTRNEETLEYYCDPSASGDLSLLEEICNSFNTFKSQFVTDKDSLMANWTAGANHEDAVNCFNNFVENADTFYSYLTNAKENLSTAVSNIAALN